MKSFETLIGEKFHKENILEAYKNMLKHAKLSTREELFVKALIGEIESNIENIEELITLKGVCNQYLDSVKEKSKEKENEED